MPRIVLDKIEKSFGSVRVLHPLELDFADGEFTVLVGPSGCGKSTTLRILAGLETASGGEIFFDEAPISQLEPKDRDIAMVFQDYALYPHMNIARNMSFALRLARTPKSEIDDKVKRVAQMLNIAHLLERKPAELSGGQRQRVAMGRALVRDAGTFLFDEPLSNLDAKLRARMRTELAEMRDQLDKNMVYVTHDQIEAMTLGDRIVVMADGVVQQQGTPQELFETPVNKFVAGFIGTPTMNFLDGALTRQDDRLWVQGDGYLLPLSPETTARINGHASGQVTMGIRPSSFTTDPGTGSPIELKLVVSEYLGTQSVLAMRCGASDVQVEVTGAPPAKAGEVITFGVKPEDIRIFDAQSGVTL
ncbi:MAG: ABC transporter ATP-binding protein [Pseudomonadota bacterium]